MRCKYENYECIEEQLDEVLETLSFSLLEPISLGFSPYHTESNDNETGGMLCSVAPEPIVIEELSTDSDVRDMVKKLALESTELHQIVSKRLLDLSVCTHGGRTTEQWDFNRCETLNGTNIKDVTLQNSVLGRYIQNVVTYGIYSVKFSRNFVTVVVTVVQVRVAELEKYLGNLRQRCKRLLSSIGKNMGHCPWNPCAEWAILTSGSQAHRGKITVSIHRKMSGASRYRLR